MLSGSKKRRNQLESRNLILRQFTYEDWNEVHTYASLSEVYQYQPWGPNTEKDSQNYVQEILQSYVMNPQTRFAYVVIHKETKLFVGAIELHLSVGKKAELSYVLHPKWWGQGYATEAAELLVNDGFNRLKLNEICATCDTRNLGSARVLEKIGMTFQKTITKHLLIRDGWRDSKFYSLRKEE
ncbi:GNAT family N-acetyltransferase [Sutcliffiella halmapala]|uniref:GNAT family N-acetyltransferase n=1 Tax=Sutcliffiella halmapala TaxID=79882 RepID=UPI000995828B|nr:GNAT family N-acetyltransferase [Sutcliffiella halmapala]